MFADGVSAEIGIGLVSGLCHMPLTLRSITVTYGDTPIHIGAAGSRYWEPRWCVLVCVTERGRTLFQACSFNGVGNGQLGGEGSVQ